jgi:hypothetical protein
LGNFLSIEKKRFLSQLQEGTGIIFRKTPGDYDYQWHCAPRKQYIINLDASVEVEVSDGEKKIIPEGEIFLVEDVKGKGHQSKSVNGKERTSIFIPIH